MAEHPMVMDWKASFLKMSLLPLLTYTSDTVLILDDFFVDIDELTNSKTHMELEEIQNHRNSSK